MVVVVAGRSRWVVSMELLRQYWMWLTELEKRWKECP
jgi:hypothetical protein